MKLKIRYDNEFQTIELDDKEAASLWFSLSIEDDETTQEEKEQLIQKEFDHQFNNPERRSWRSHNAHTGDAVLVGKDGTTEINTEEAVYQHTRDHSMYFREMDAAELGQNYDIWRGIIREAFPGGTAEMLIAIALEGMKAGEYAALIGDTPNNVSHRYRRALKKIRILFNNNQGYNGVK